MIELRVWLFRKRWLWKNRTWKNEKYKYRQLSRETGKLRAKLYREKEERKKRWRRL